MQPQPTASEHDFLGTRMQILAGAADTGGAVTVLRQWCRYGFSPPLHIDAEDTGMLVVSGSLTTIVGDCTLDLGPGDFAWLPRGIPHTFCVESQEADLVQILLPGGFEGFIRAVVDEASEHGARSSEVDVARLAELGRRFGNEVVGPPLTPRRTNP